MLIRADARAIPLANETVHCVVTSPPYWGLRDYGLGPACIGLEPTPEQYVNNMVAVFREVRRVLKPTGTLWLNLGDCYAAGGRGSSEHHIDKIGAATAQAQALGRKVAPVGLKPKDLVGIPWRVAFALQANGWYLRSDIIWAKPNPMPESVTDRPTKAHEYIFLLSKSERYLFDRDAVSEPCKWPEGSWGRSKSYDGDKTGKLRSFYGDGRKWEGGENRNIRTVWVIATQPYKGSHFATYPEAIPERCIKAGSKPGDLILDPFGGSGTTGRVAERLNRRWVCMDLKYHDLSSKRTSLVQKQLLEYSMQVSAQAED